MLKLFILLTSLIGLGHAGAQGTAFTYQGQLDANGAPVNGSYDFTFTLYTNASGGTATQGPVTNLATAVSNGLFTTTVNFGAEVFTGTSYWLQIAARTNETGAFTTLTPRQEITPTPYALFAPNAGLAGSAGSVAASNVTGTLALDQLPASLLTNGQTGVSLSGEFAGNGTSLTNIPLTGLASGGSLGLTNAGLYFSFGGTFNYPGSGSIAVVPATNLNGLGNVDLVAVNRSSNSLTVLTNNGSGNFAPAGTPSVGLQPTSVAIADVNNDGWPDLIAANSGSNSLTILTNNRIGQFELYATLIVGNGPISVIAADVNNDGYPDLICANSGSGTLTVLTNNHSGGFAVSATPNLGSSSEPQSVVAADVNGDGRLDLICANYGLNNVNVLINNGGGTFLAPVPYMTGNQPFLVVAGDVNGDGWADIICGAGSGGPLTIFTNDGAGTGTFTLASTTVNLQPGNLLGLALADFLGDGRPDIVCGLENASLQIMVNAGNGDFVLGPAVAVTPPASIGGFASMSGVATVDVNGDGKPDVVSVNYENTIGGETFLFEMLNNSQLPATELMLAGQSGGLSLAPGYDGVPNLVGGSSGNLVSAGVDGAVIAGGGSPGSINLVSASFGNIDGGAGNSIQFSADYSSVGGGESNLVQTYANYSSIGGGFQNSNSGEYAFLGGGQLNVAYADWSVLGGGKDNATFGTFSTLGGGEFNTNSGLTSTIGGGLSNVMSFESYYAFIGGGYDNYTYSFYTTVGGGAQNQAVASGAFVGGGGYNGTNFLGNIAKGNASVIGGGYGNTNSGAFAAIPGGYQNLAGGVSSFAAGANAQAVNAGAFVWSDGQGTPFSSTTANQFSVRANGGVRFVTSGASFTLDGLDVLTGTSSLNGGGLTNLTAANLTGSGTLPLGVLPSAVLTNNNKSAVTLNGTFSGTFSGTGSGLTSLTAANVTGAGTLPDSVLSNDVALLDGSPTFTSSVAIYTGNTSTPSLSLLGAGINSFGNSVLLIKNTNTTDNNGPALRVVNEGGTNVWGALCVSANVGTGANNGLIASFGNTTTFVVQITNDGTIYSKGLALSSDRELKENFTPLEASNILAKVVALPVTKWNYKDDAADKKHIGPVAQDFQAAFGLNGSDDKHIFIADEGGVALAAIQGLNQKLEEQRSENALLRRELDELKEAVKKLEDRK